MNNNYTYITYIIFFQLYTLFNSNFIERVINFSLFLQTRFPFSKTFSKLVERKEVLALLKREREKELI